MIDSQLMESSPAVSLVGFLCATDGWGLTFNWFSRVADSQDIIDVDLQAESTMVVTRLFEPLRKIVRLTLLPALVFAFGGCTADTSTLSESPLELLRDCRDVLGEVNRQSETRLLRRDGEWRLISVDAWACPDVNLSSIEYCESIESLDVQWAYHELQKGTREGIATIERFPKLRELSINSHDFINAVDLGNAKFASLESLHLHGDAQATEAILSHNSAFPLLTTLVIDAPVIGDGLTNLNNYQNLEALAVFSSQLTDDSLVDIVKLPNLRSLDLCCCDKITERGIRNLASLTRLKKLTLWEINQSMMPALETLPALEILECNFSDPVMDFRRLRRLRSWKMSEEQNYVEGPPVRVLLSPSVEEISCNFQFIPVVSDLEVSQIHTARISGSYDSNDSTAPWIRTLPNLKNLTFINAGDGDIEDISKLTGLRSLVLDGQCSHFSSNAIEKLRGLTQLETLEIEISGAPSGLDDLERLKKLSLWINKENVANLKNISNLRELRSVRLWFVRDTREWPIQALANMECLEELAIGGRITDEALMHLITLSKLRLLDLSNAADYSDEALARLMSQMPNLQEVVK